MGYLKEEDGTEANKLSLEQMEQCRQRWDREIVAEQARHRPDSLLIQRLKRLKLHYKQAILARDPDFFHRRQPVQLKLVA